MTRLLTKGTAFAYAGLLLAFAGCSDSSEGELNNNAPQPPYVCGDGIVTDYYEMCEPGNLQGLTCKSLGWQDGELSCRPDCQADWSQCTGPNPCGNGVIDMLEGCDGTNMGGWRCEDLPGLTGGILSCTPDCRHNQYQCIAADTCGDGVHQDTEWCDNGADNSDTEPNACRTNCRLAGCGDGIIDAGEDCDEGPLNSNVQSDACRGDCQWAHCGDGVTDTGEDCDSIDLGGASCASLGYISGTLLCHFDCSFDASGCQ